MQSAALSEIVERQLSGAELGNSKDSNRCKVDLASSSVLNGKWLPKA